MAVPKRKTSKARRDKRRNSHWKLSLPGMTKCPKWIFYSPEIHVLARIL